jgi:CBS domain-containing protein
MSGELILARTDESLDDALFSMRRSGVRRLPIVGANGELVGMVTLDDIMVLLAGELSCGVDAVLDNRGP